MRLEQKAKELAAIGAAIGANCRPCIEHHLPAGREAGLSADELADAVGTAEAVRDRAVELFSARVEELLERGGAAPEPSALADTSRTRELVALGASVGANSHPLLDLHIVAGLDVGLTPAQVEAALKMAQYVQRRAGEMTAVKATHALDERATAAPPLQRARAQKQQKRRFRWHANRSTVVTSRMTPAERYGSPARRSTSCRPRPSTPSRCTAKRTRRSYVRGFTTT